MTRTAYQDNRAHTVGIDVGKYHADIRALFFAQSKYIGWIRRHNKDPEDFLQELYIKLFKANSGRSPFDGKGKGWSSYIVRSMHSSASNEMAKVIRREKVSLYIDHEKGLAPEANALGIADAIDAKTKAERHVNTFRIRTGNALMTTTTTRDRTPAETERVTQMGLIVWTRYKTIRKPRKAPDNRTCSPAYRRYKGWEKPRDQRVWRFRVGIPLLMTAYREHAYGRRTRVSKYQMGLMIWSEWIGGN